MASWGKLTPTQELMLDCSIIGDINLAQSLMSLDPHVLRVRNSHGLSILQIALVQCNFHFAEYLVRKGVDVHNRDNRGWTALHDAALFNSKELVNMLVQSGCNLATRNQSGEMPIDVAADTRMESLLCQKMANAGYRALAKKYWTSLGLDHLCPSKETNSLMDIESSSDEDEFDDVDVNQSSFDSFGNVDRSQDSASNKCYSYNVLNISHHSKEAIPSRPTLYEIRQQDNIKLHSIGSSSCRIYSTRTGRPRPTPLSPLPECLVEKNNFDYCETEDFDSVFTGGNLQLTTSPVPKRKASFAPRNKSMCSISSVNISRSHSYDNFSDKQDKSDSELTRSSSMYLTAEELAKLGQSSVINDRAPIELLKMRPRKPSLVDAKRRKSKEEESLTNGFNRRSVSFQPEVLLQEVVTEGDTDLAKEIISSGTVDVNKMSPVGLTALHQCALDGNLELAKTLVLNGADVNNIDADGWSPLHGAAATGHTEIVRFLLLAGSDPVLKNDEGHTPYQLARKGSIKRILFRAQTQDLNEDEISDGEFSSDGEEEEYSHVESESDDEDACLSDSDPNLTANWKKLSILQESLKNVRESSVSPSPVRDSVFTGLQNPSLIAAALLKDRELGDSTSSYGSMLDQDMLDRHECLEEVDDVETSSVKTMSTLCNDDVYLTDTDKDTYFSEDQGIGTMDASSDSSHRRAICSDDEGTFRDVLDSELIPDTPDYKFQEAILNCDIDSLLKLLKIKSDIDVNRINKTSGISVLHYAVLEENYVFVQHLVCDFKCDINLKDADGWTPLHAASAVGSIRIAQFLLENGAKASILNNNCEFPVDVAEDEAMEDLLKKAMLGPTVGKVFKGYFR